VDSPSAWPNILVPLTVPMLVSPGSVALAVSYSARLGGAATLGGAALALAVTAPVFAAAPAIEGVITSRFTSLLARLNGALVGVIAAELMLDSVRSV
jgi:small neutral amino acid transporter SnatA (MarC family)